MATVRQALQPLLARAGLGAADVTLDGSQSEKLFTLRPVGGDDADKRRVVDALLAARKDAGGEWILITAPTPTGATARVYLDRDRSWAQRRRGFAIAKAAEALRSAAPGRAFVPVNGSGAVLLDWAEVATFTWSDAERDVIAQWHTERLATAGIDVASARAAYRAAMGSARSGPPHG